MFRINTNVQAMSALRSLSGTASQAQTAMSRLSSGLRINSGADDPAGLQISEGFKAQIGGLDQALRNNQDAMNFAKTAEGALGEVSSLLNDARSLALANSNDATLSATQKAANQQQLTSIMASIDRISTNTQYGSKKLLDGSAGVSAAIVTSTRVGAIQLGGQVGTNTLNTNGTLTLTTVGTAAKATVAGAAVTAGTAVGASGNLTINGTTFAVTASMTNQEMIDAINAKSATTGVAASISGGNFTLTATKYGANGNNIQVTNDVAGIGFAAAGTRNLASGANITSLTATGSWGGFTATTFTADANDQNTWRDSSGNVVKLTDAALATAGAATIAVTAGSAQFQIGANSGQTASLSLASAATGTLGLSSLDIQSTSGASAALAAIDTAIATVSSNRGSIGNFVRNVIESNSRSLSVARENLTAANSSIRDADVAEEMTRFTQLQIMQQSGLSMLAQANSQSQSVLALLRG